MTDDYSRYERESEKIRENNARLIDQFSTWLNSKDLSEKAIAGHRSNVDFYINEFLLYEDAVHPEDGALDIGMFLGYWFIRKAMWATKASIKSNAASIKRFYGFMLEKGMIEQKDFDELKRRIKEDMPEWLATLERYDDLSIEDPDKIWGY